MRKRRGDERKRDGLCSRCGKWEPIIGYTRCQECVNTDREYRRLRIRNHPLAVPESEAHTST